MKKPILLLLLFSTLPIEVAAGSDLTSKSEGTNVLRIYHDADWSNNLKSAQAIWRGADLALSEINHTVQGRKIELVKKDHHGSVLRSKKNNQAYISDSQALAVLSGIHSPPLIKNRAFINENNILTLVPWAAGGPITRYPSPENWIFRLSLDDTKVAPILVDFAIQQKECKSPHLVLEDTPWGDSNLKSMQTSLQAHNISTVGVQRFNWSIQPYTARNMLQSTQKAGADCILLVANSNDGAVIAKVMADLGAENRLPIISHWGLTSGDFHLKVDSEERKNIELDFIQSCFSFMQQPLIAKGRSVFQAAKAQFPNAVKSPSDIHSPVGFIHAYDLTTLLIAALNKIELGDNILENRNKVRLALEGLNQPVQGLVKTYEQPFSIFSDNNIDAHEALGSQDYCMAQYDAENNIIVQKN